MQNRYSLKLVQSTSHDPWFNLSLEEQLLNTLKKDEIILFLWQNDKTVVIGRNQNPWRECRVTELENEGGRLARRLSGGGAVYHDLGNLNFTFIAKEDHYDIEKHLKVIIDAVNLHGINAEFSGRNDILANGRKFSGNAFHYDEDNCYHHGTLLVSSDINKLSRYLQISKEKIQSKGIESVESRVINLSSLNSSINISSLSDSLKISFECVYNNKIAECVVIQEDLSNKLYKKYSSWDWRYGETPDFEINYYNRFSWGDLDIYFNLKEGTICDAKVFSDSMNSELIMSVEQAFRGLKFVKDSIIMKINDLKRDNDIQVIEEISLWLSKQDI